MKYKWTNTREIAIELYENNPELDPKFISFPKLYGMVLEMKNFDDSPKRCNERILEAIQSAWMDEAYDD